MEGNERREQIIKLLMSNTDPISGNELAKLLGVSRQIIVQDIALLRATNKHILSTTKGYVMYYAEKQTVNRCFLVRHSTEQIEEELCIIVDNGGKVLDVVIMHELYGQIEADLIIATRQDILDFVKKASSKKTKPLKELTDGVHLHTVEAPNEMVLDRIQEQLDKKGFLVNEE